MQEKPVIAVAGAGPGIGEAIARRFAAKGYVTTLLAHTVNNLKSTYQHIKADFRPRISQYYLTNLQIEDQVISNFDTIRAQLGPVQVLIYNASAHQMNGRTVLDTTTEEFKSFTKINLFDAFWSSKCIIPDMLTTGRRTIIFTGATSSLRGMLPMEVYLEGL